jgi:EAL domain-containing protein (putative c-di-GMP-specific phosphodiesterase class I)
MPSLLSSAFARSLLFGLLGVLLQQVAVPYSAHLLGLTQDASLLHLHVGLLLAVAMLERDPRVVAGAFAVVFLGWVVRAWSVGYDMVQWLPIGFAAYALTWGWTVGCARWMGWPRPPPVRIEARDLARFALIGLLLFPLGTAAIAYLSALTLPPAERLVTVLQILFARHFGVVVLTFPVVVGWCARHAPGPSRAGGSAWGWPLLLLAGALASVLLTWQAAPSLAQLGGERRVVLMDYRIAVFALVGWSLLRLRPRTAMALLALALFALVQGLAGSAERSGTPVGFVNLVHLAFELSVLLMAALYLHVIERDARELAVRLKEESLHDGASGLPNLAALREQVERGGGGTGEIGFLLLDHTDALAAGFGLDMQKQVTTTVATRLAGIARVYVVGNGQFVLQPVDGAEEPWRRAIEAIETVEMDREGEHFGLSPYLGVARPADVSRMAFELALRLASQLAFEARGRSEMRPVFADAGAHPRSATMRQQLQAAADALACLRRRRLELHFQTIRPLDPAHPAAQEPDYASGEVLCRLRDAQGRLLTPDEFLAPIEAVGRSVELDLAVLSGVLELLRQYPRALPRIRHLAVNLTGQSLASTTFRGQLDELLADSPLPLTALCFEITENAVIAGEAHTRGFLESLRSRGCRIAIDDFGRGMQSFWRLKELPVDIIKIDGAFIGHVAERGRDYTLVEASVSIARAFEAETVAEYVETEATADCLRELGVQWMQGYLHSRPRPLAELLATAR